MTETAFTDRFAGYSTVRLHGLGDVLREHRRSRGSGLALVQRDRRITYAEFDARVNQLAGFLRSSGVGPRGRVLWLGQNSFRLLETLLACAKLGAILCVANWRLAAEEMSHVLGDFDPQVAIWQDVDLADLARSVRGADTKERIWIRQDGSGEGSYEEAIGQFPDFDDDARVSPEEPVLAIYSSAFEGRPRAALLTHSAILYQDLVMGRAQDISHETVILNSGPLFHLGTLMGMLATFHHGGVNVFLRRMDAETALQLIEQHRITHAFLPGPTLQQVREINRDGVYDVSSIFEQPDASDWTSKSGMCAPKTASIVRAPGGYGQTEVMGHVSLRAFGGEGGCGRPHPMVQLIVADDDGREVPHGEVGEILVRGPMVMIGYHGDGQVDTSREIAGWHRTNDLGRRLPDGSLTFVGPKQTMIKTGKENVYPAEVEICLRAHPSVQEACVIGVPDPLWQQNVVAVLELVAGSEPVSAEEIIEHCRSRLASYKKPKHVIVVEALPRAGGLIDRAAVDEAHGGGGYPSM